MQDESSHQKPNGRPHPATSVEICDTIVIGRGPAATAPSDEQEFEVVGIVEDPTSSLRHAVCYCEASDAFIVTDDAGALIEDDALAQEILEDFLEHAQGSSSEEDR
jgi:hypothetical protein